MTQPRHRLHSRPLLAAALAVAALAAPGCETGGQTGLLAGAGVGALMGQAIGGNTAGTLIGTAVGGGIGYIIGNERDKARAADLNRQNAEQIARLESQLAAQAAATGTAAPIVAADRPTHTEVGPLGGSRWMLVSVNPRDAAPPHASILVEFRPNGRVLTTTTRTDGVVETADECYRVVGDTLIVNRPGYLVNARFQVNGDQLVISADRFSAVLRRLPS